MRPSFSFRVRLCFLALLLLPLLPLSAQVQTTPAQTPPSLITTPTLITAPGQSHAPAPPVLIAAPSAAALPLALSYTGAYIGGAASARTLTLPAGLPPLPANPLVSVGGTVTNQVVTTLPDGRQQVTFGVAVAGGQGGKVAVSLPSLPALAPALFFNTGGFDHSRPPGSRAVTSANKGNVFTGATPAACAPVLTFANADGKVVAYKVISAVNGSVAAQGTVPAGASSVSPALSAFGPYYVYVLGAASQGQYGPVLGATAFGLVPTPLAGINLPGLPPKSAFVQSAPFFDADAAQSGWMQAGPERYSIYNAAAPEGELPNLIVNINAEKASYVTGLDGTLADPVRGRPIFVNFVGFSNAPGEAAGITRAVARLYPLGVIYFEGKNEPTPNADSVALLRAFYAAVKAGNPNAQVIGPAFVTATAGLDSFLAGCSGNYPFDELSFHAYNAVNGDYDMGERVMSQQDAFLAKYGLQTRRRWQTEQSPPAGLSGLNNPIRPVAWLAAQTLVFERHHQPIETSYYWHHRANGDWGFPSWAENFDGSFTGTALFLRQFAEQTWCKPFASAYDFGPANSLWYGDRFDGQGPAAGQSVSVFAGKQTQGERLTLALSGPNIPNSLTAVDAYGNPTTYAVVKTQSGDNQVTLDGNNSPVCYIAHSNSLTLSPVGTDWGANLALNAPVIVPTNQSTASRITNGVWENGYDFSARAWGSDPAWMASSDQQGAVSAPTALPYSVIIDLGADKAFSRVVFGGPPLWQNMSSIVSARVYTAAAADVPHVDASAGTVITGTAFADASGPSGGAAPSRTPNNVFGGTAGTGYQSAATGGYVGLDAGAAQPISFIRYTTGARYSEGSLVGGVFEGSNTSQTAGYAPLATITSNPGSGTHTLAVTDHTPYRWCRFRARAGQQVNIGDISFVQGVVAQSVSTSGRWALKKVIGQASPLLEIFNDEGTTATQATDYTPQVARWDVVMPEVTARFVRIEFDAVTYGGAGSLLAYQYGGQGGYPQVSLSEIQAFAR